MYRKQNRLANTGILIKEVLILDSSIERMNRSARSFVNAARVKYLSAIRSASSLHLAKLTSHSTITLPRLIKRIVVGVYATAVVSSA